jgi:hypothetical protein
MKSDEDKQRVIGNRLIVTYSGEPGERASWITHSGFAHSYLFCVRRHGAICRVHRRQPDPSPSPSSHASSPRPVCSMDPSNTRRLAALASSLPSEPTYWRLRHDNVGTPSVLGRLPGDLDPRTLCCPRLRVLLLPIYSRQMAQARRNSRRRLGLVAQVHR